MFYINNWWWPHVYIEFKEYGEKNEVQNILGHKMYVQTVVKNYAKKNRSQNRLRFFDQLDL